jgi:MoxR-like ATPase
MSETWPTLPSPTPAEPVRTAASTLGAAHDVVQRLRARLRAAIIGRDEVVDLIVVALLADGHVLLEDYPGSGKTTLARALGESLVDDGPHDEIVAMRRIQFTPDLMPSDVTGTTIFDPESNRFFFRPGPIFAHIVLADEINRTSPKVQAALLEAMAEKQVTIDNQTHRLDELFLVIATQNPLDLAGTFPLPAAQLDRFLFKIRMTHISRDAELIVLKTLGDRKAGARPELPRVTRSEILAARAAIERDVFVADAIQEALVDIAERTRNDDRIILGTSTRSLVLAMPALRARALLVGRDFVSPDDVAYLAPLVFAHRIETAPGIDDAAEAIRECCTAPLEKLARASLHTLRRG